MALSRDASLFGPGQLAKLVRETLPPPGGDHTLAAVGTVDASGVQIVANFTKPAGAATWTFQGAYRHTWTGDDAVTASVIFTR